MINVDVLTFNPFGEHTYLLSDETGECAIVDPGNYFANEDEFLCDYITQKGYKPVALWFTHLHLDHTFGSAFVAEKYGLEGVAHKDDLPQLELTPKAAALFGIELNRLPIDITHFYDDDSIVTFGKSSMRVLHVPGHSAGGVALYAEADGFCLSGDSLFNGGIGRTDMVGGDSQLLLQSLRDKLLSLPRATKIYPGHGMGTTIEHEMISNPYIASI